MCAIIFFRFVINIRKRLFLVWKKTKSDGKKLPFAKWQLFIARSAQKITSGGGVACEYRISYSQHSKEAVKSSLSQFQIEILILLCRTFPGQVLIHISLNHLVPTPAIREIQVFRSVDGIQQQAGIIAIKGKAVSGI